MSIFSNKKMPEKLQQKKKREDRKREKREKNDKKERKIQNYTERKHKNIITKVLNLPPLAFDIWHVTFDIDRRRNYKLWGAMGENYKRCFDARTGVGGPEFFDKLKN